MLMRLLTRREGKRQAGHGHKLVSPEIETRSSPCVDGLVRSATSNLTISPIPLAPLQIAAIDRPRRIRLLMMHPSMALSTNPEIFL